ncbi:MAG: hypothetical protein WCR70_08955, partial [Sphaerochaetaceae bacterium]
MTDRMLSIGVHLLINVGSRRCVYNSKTGAIYEVDRLTWEILRFVDNTGEGSFDSDKLRGQLGCFEEDLQRIRDDLVRSELISCSPGIERFEMKQIHLTGIELLINQGSFRV